MYLICLSFRDVAAVIDAVEPEAPIILVGHSMGGAVAVRAAQLITNLYGLGVIDVVEGTAMDALASMQSFLRSRPSSFSTISQAIEWWLVFIDYLTSSLLRWQVDAWVSFLCQYDIWIVHIYTIFKSQLYRIIFHAKR